MSEEKQVQVEEETPGFNWTAFLVVGSLVFLGGNYFSDGFSLGGYVDPVAMTNCEAHFEVHSCEFGRSNMELKCIASIKDTIPSYGGFDMSAIKVWQYDTDGVLLRQNQFFGAPTGTIKLGQRFKVSTGLDHDTGSSPYEVYFCSENPKSTPFDMHNRAVAMK